LIILHLSESITMPLNRLLILAGLGVIAGSVLLFPGCKKDNGPSFPRILSVSPAIDTVGGIVTITGTNFNTDPTLDTVIFNNDAYAVVLTASATQLTVAVPYWATNGRIVVKSDGYTSQTSQDFAVAPKFSPQSEGTGYSILVIAAGLSSTLSDDIVKFNGVPAKVTAIFENQLTVVVPAGVTNGPISVSVKGQTATSLSSFIVAPIGLVSTFAGTGTGGSDNGIGNAASFFIPVGLKVDNSGNVYVADRGNGLIRMISASGMVSTFAGNGSFGSTDGPLLSSAFYGPTAIFIANNGDIYVTDQFSGAIRKISSGNVTTIAGLGIHGASFSNPTGICMDSAGNLYIGDSFAMKIREISPAGTVMTVAGSGSQTWLDGPAATAAFDDPQGVVVDPSGNLFVADYANNMIRKINTSGTVNTFAGYYQGYKDGIGNGAYFNLPADIALDGGGNIYVADGGNNVIRRIKPDGTVTTIAGNPLQKGDAEGDGTAAGLNNPSGIAIDANGTIYISDMGNNKIRKIVLH
jgi:sugar lactone lactonase YvrE